MVDFVSLCCTCVQTFIALPCVANQFNYLFRYKKLVDSLNNELIPDLENASNKLRVYEEQASRNDKAVYDDVTLNLQNVDKLTQDARALAQTLIGGGDPAPTRCKCCNLRFVPSLKSRRLIGKEAFDLADKVKKTLTDINELLKNEKLVAHASYKPSASTNIPNQGYEVFKSREDIVNNIKKALEDESVTRIGVHGMPGIGKTMLVKDIKNELALRNDKLFAEVIFVPVSKDPDYVEIQKNIAEQLGMAVDRESVAAKAKRIRKILEKGTFLVILDDLWKELKLDDVGIPDPEELEAKGCKIILTSCFDQVLKDMKATNKTFRVEALHKAEAMLLFEKIAGEIVTNRDFQSLATEIVQQCAGLPVALEALASTLKNQALPSWKHTLTQLQQSILTGNEKMNEKVYVNIKMVYELLDDEDAKALFLLCCLQQEEANMSMYYTFIYAAGWGLFERCRTLEEAIHSLFAVLEKLKGHCLLLEGDNRWSVKMHDIVRDVGIDIAAKSSRMYNIKSNDELENYLKNAVLKDSTAISLLYNGVNLPEMLECPQLRLALLWKIGYRSTPELFFQETKELRVLDLSYTQFEKLPSSFDVLANLRTLVLCGSYLSDITMIGELKNLEFLELERSNIDRLPEEIGKLARLRLLSLYKCSSLKSIPPNVISKLTKLEELNMLYTPNMQWEVEGSNERKNASLVELRALTKLQALHIDLSSDKILPKGLFSEKLERCDIVIDNQDSPCDWYQSKLSTNFQQGTKVLKLYLKDSCFVQEYDLEGLMGSICNELQLFGLEGTNSLVSEISTSGFPKLKHLAFQNNNSIRYLTDYSSQENGIHSNNAFQCLESLRLWKINNLQQMIHGQLSPDSFSRLCEIEVKHCGNLRNLFPLSVARNLQQLGSITLQDCKMMDATVNYDHNNDDHPSSLLFPRLHYMSLYDLPLIVSHLSSKSERTNSPFFSGKVQWGISTCFQNLTVLYVWRCNCLKYLFSASVAVNLAQLGRLDIQECDMMEEIIIITDPEDQKTEAIVFTQLHTLILAHLPNLTRFCSPKISIKFPLLANFRKDACPKLVFSSDTVSPSNQLLMA